MLSQLPFPTPVKKQARAAVGRLMTANFAKHFIAGATVDDAFDVIHRLHDERWRCTICPWDAVGEDPKNVFRSYREALARLREDNRGARLSIKLPSLRYDSGMMRALLEEAKPSGVTVHCDSLAPESADPTFAVIEALRPTFANIGCTLPARWRRSIEDCRKAIDLEIDVRVVKGQWRDAENEELDLRAAFLRLVRALLGSQRTIGLATHDAPLLASAAALCEGGKAPFEVEQLFGLPVVPRVFWRGAPGRIYIPYGHAYLPYALHELVQKPRLIVWLLKDAVKRKTAENGNGCDEEKK